MAWSTSKVFVALPTAAFNKTKGWTLTTDTIEAALFDNTITPDATVSAANSAYAAGVWASGGVSDAVGWPALGRPLQNETSAATSNVYKFDADDTVSANATTTLTNAYGCLIYDHTTTSPAGTTDQGMCFNYFGGANTVTSGTFTVVWNSSGIFTVTV